MIYYFLIDKSAFCSHKIAKSTRSESRSQARSGGITCSRNQVGTDSEMIMIACLLVRLAHEQPFVRWVTGGKGGTRPSCTTKCASLGLTCAVSRMREVYTVARFRGAHTAMVAQGDVGMQCSASGADPFCCASQNGYGSHSPASDGTWCYAGAAPGHYDVTCSSEPGGWERLCCCIASGENAQTVCPVQASDCIDATWDAATFTCVPPTM